METIKVLYKQPYKDCEIIEVPNDFSEIKKLIDCRTVEGVTFPLDRDVIMLIDDDGKLEKLDGNFFIPEYQDCTVGNCVFVQVDEDGDFTSLSEHQINKIKKYLKHFSLVEGEDLCGEDGLYLIAKHIKKYEKLMNEGEL